MKQPSTYPIVSAEGDIDLSNIRELETILEAAAQINVKGVILDMTQTTYFGSRTVHVLLRFSERLRVNRKKLVIIKPQSVAALRLIEITGIDKLVGIYDSVDDATKLLDNSRLD